MEEIVILELEDNFNVWVSKTAKELVHIYKTVKHTWYNTHIPDSNEIETTILRLFKELNNRTGITISTGGIQVSCNNGYPVISYVRNYIGHTPFTEE